jgi:glutaconate CoA-transferase, subunit B
MLADLVITAAAEAWRGAGEIIATGIGPIPRLAASLAKSSFAPDLLLTDAEVFYRVAPVPLGKRVGPEPTVEGWAPYTHMFDMLWSGHRHAMVAPVQLDRFGQVNISVIGDHAKPKSAMLGARGFPGNSVHHPNSFFFPQHSKRAFVGGEVDFVCSAGYNPARFPGGRLPPWLDLRLIVTNLAVLDFGGPEHAIRVRSLHPGVTFEQVQDSTGFPLARADTLPVTPAPGAAEIAMIAALDPGGVRHTIVKAEPA